MPVLSLVSKFHSSKFVRFGFVGGLGFVVNEAALLVAHNGLHAGPKLSWLIAFAPSVVFTWWGNRRLTFCDAVSKTPSGTAAELLRFVATNSLGAAANFAVYALLTAKAPFPLNVPYLALFAGVLVGLVFNFTLSKKFVFKK